MSSFRLSFASRCRTAFILTCPLTLPLMAASACSEGTDSTYVGSTAASGGVTSLPASSAPESASSSQTTSTSPAITDAPVVPPGTWDQDLTIGPNGPIPVIVVDQFGYRPTDAKVAVLRDPRTGFDEAVEFTPGATVYVVESATNTVVKAGAPVTWNNGAVDSLSGDAAWSFDFSEVTQPGKYFVYDAQSGRRSPEFEIKEDVYREVLRHAFRTFFYQRAGFEKTAEFAGADWSDGASHLGPGQDGEARSWLDQGNTATAKDLRGGWYDAGDYNKYTTWHSRYIINLLRTFAF
jgi:endoglucanase